MYSYICMIVGMHVCLYVCAPSSTTTYKHCRCHHSHRKSWQQIERLKTAASFPSCLAEYWPEAGPRCLVSLPEAGPR